MHRSTEFLPGSTEQLDSGAHQMHSSGAHQSPGSIPAHGVHAGAALSSAAPRGPGQSGPRDPDPWSTGGLRPRGRVSIRLKRELVFSKETVRIRFHQRGSDASTKNLGAAVKGLAGGASAQPRSARRTRTRGRTGPLLNPPIAVAIAAAGCLSSPVRDALDLRSCPGGAGGVGRLQTRAPPGAGTPDGAVQAPVLEAPVITSLTDAERAKLARKAAEANKRSEDDVRARGGR